MRNLYVDENTVHLGLKPEHIMFDEYGRAYISSVGIAKQFHSKALAKLRQGSTYARGDSKWMSPEMLRTYKSHNLELTQFDSKIDSFSLGLICLYAIDKDNFLKQQESFNNDEEKLENYLRDIESRGIINNEEFFSYIRKMLSFDMEKRINLEELYDWMVII